MSATLNAQITYSTSLFPELISMYIDPTSLSAMTLLSGWVILLFCLGLVCMSRPWRNQTDSPMLLVLPAFVVCLMLVWRVKAGLHQGLEIHLLGLTAITLMFGRGLAILAVTSVYCILAFSGKIPWSILGWNAVLVGVLPILLAAQIHQWVFHKLPHNFFIFVFLSSFLNGAIVMIFSIGILAIFMLLTASHPVDLIQSEFLLLMPLLMFPEAFLNGSLMAILVIYRPQWVSGFDENRYMRS